VPKQNHIFYDWNTGELINDKDNLERIELILNNREKNKWGLELCNNIIIDKLEKGYLGRFKG